MIYSNLLLASVVLIGLVSQTLAQFGQFGGGPSRFGGGGFGGGGGPGGTVSVIFNLTGPFSQDAQPSLIALTKQLGRFHHLQSLINFQTLLLNTTISGGFGGGGLNGFYGGRGNPWAGGSPGFGGGFGAPGGFGGGLGGLGGLGGFGGGAPGEFGGGFGGPGGFGGFGGGAPGGLCFMYSDRKVCQHQHHYFLG